MSIISTGLHPYKRTCPIALNSNSHPLSPYLLPSSLPLLAQRPCGHCCLGVCISSSEHLLDKIGLSILDKQADTTRVNAFTCLPASVNQYPQHNMYQSNQGLALRKVEQCHAWNRLLWMMLTAANPKARNKETAAVSETIPLNILIQSHTSNADQSVVRRIIIIIIRSQITEEVIWSFWSGNHSCIESLNACLSVCMQAFIWRLCSNSEGAAQECWNMVVKQNLLNNHVSRSIKTVLEI